MKHYQRAQFGWFIILFVPILVLLTLSYIYQWGQNPLDIVGYIIFLIILIICILLFYGMTVKVDEEYITISYGIGFIIKKIHLSRIKNVNIVRNPWYYGLGIRFIPNGMLYSIHGLNAVELKFKDAKKIIQIGSDDCTKLKEAIDSKLMR